MNLYIWGFIATLALKSFMSMGGVGAAFILVPIFYWMGMSFPQAAAVGLMLGVLSTSVASINFAKDKLINFKVAIPMIIAILVLSPLGVYVSNSVNKNILLGIFSVFLIIAGTIMMFYHPKRDEANKEINAKPLASLGIGGLVGFLSGMLGIGGGSFLGPFLVWLGMDGKEVAGTSSLVVMFSSLIGFLGHVGLEYSHFNYVFLIITGIAAIMGGYIGSWLARFKLTGNQIKQIIGVFQYLVAIKIIIDLASVWGK
ncbi:Membrane protein [Candidatus Desulfosporosinus infrequens]|uniref:Probable membrane transporter protein n=1 Tax=Candidatus Desulfosporosinus infrequens TaxID=2043169 RepID=A0A2U3K2D7_9FIRM|nr:Membrane protein [Candidatus Desulfosporosinus infrequens]